MDELTPEMLARLEPDRFEHLVVDLLRACAAGTARLRAFGLGYGKPDGGWDAELEGEFEGLSGTIRVDAKRRKNLSKVKEALQHYLRSHRTAREQGDSLLLVTNVECHRDEVKALEELGPHGKVRVLHGPDVISRLRAHPYIARAYGLLPFRDDLHPLDEWLADRPRRLAAALPSEATCLDEALAEVASGRDLVFRAEPHWDVARCLDRLLARLQAQGSAGLQEVVVLDPAVQPHHLRNLARELCPGRRLVVIPPGITTTTIEAVLKWPGSVTLLRAAYEHELLTVRGEFKAARRPVRETTVPAPSPEEITARAKAQAPNLHEAELADVVVALKNPDWVHLYQDDPADLIFEIGKTLTGADRAAATWVGLLGAVVDDEIDALAAALERTGGDVMASLEVASKAGVLVRTGTTHKPLAELVAAATVLAYSRDVDLARLSRIWSRLPAKEQATALRGLGRWRYPNYGDRSPSAIAAMLLDGVTDREARRAFVALAPEAFCDNDPLFAEACEVARGLPASSWVVSTLIRRAPRTAASMEAAWDLLEHLLGETPSPRATITDLAKALVSPAHGANAADVRTILKACRPRLDGEAAPAAAMVAEGVIHMWTGNTVAWQRSHSRVVRFGELAWVSGSVAVQEAFREAGAWITKMLTHDDAQVRLVGLRTLGSFGTSRGIGQPSIPEPLAAVGRDVLKELCAWVAQQEDWVVRGVAEAELVKKAGNQWVDPVGVALTRALHRDPLYLAFRATALQDGFVADPALLQTEVEAGQELSAVLRAHRRAAFARVDHLGALTPHVERLEASPYGPDDLERMLTWFDQLYERIDELPSRPWGNGVVLRAWAERRPSIFEPLLFGPRWNDLSDRARTLLIRSAAAAFPAQRVARLSGTQEDTGPGLETELARFLARPSTASMEQALAYQALLQEITPTDQVLATIERAAAHPDPTVREDLCLWLLQATAREPRLPTPPVHAVLRALIRAPGGLRALAMWVNRAQEPKVATAVAIPPGSAAERLALQALVLGMEQLEQRLDDNQAWLLRPLFAPLAQRRAEDWWRVMPRRLHELNGEYVLDGLDDEAVLALLAVGPATDALTDPDLAETVDTLVRAVSPQRLAAELAQRINGTPEDRQRAVLWLGSADMHPSLANVTAAALAYLTEPARREAFTERTARGLGHRGMRIFIGDGAPPAEDTDETADAYLQLADEVGGPVGRDLRWMAEHHARYRWLAPGAR